LLQLTIAPLGVRPVRIGVFSRHVIIGGAIIVGYTRKLSGGIKLVSLQGSKGWLSNKVRALYE